MTKTHHSATCRCAGESCICLECCYDRLSTAYFPIPLGNKDSLGDLEYLGPNMRHNFCIRCKFHCFRWYITVYFWQHLIQYLWESDDETWLGYFNARCRSSVTSHMCNSVKYSIVQFVWSLLWQAMIHYLDVSFQPRHTCSHIRATNYISVCFNLKHVFFDFESMETDRHTECHLARHFTFR